MKLNNSSGHIELSKPIELKELVFFFFFFASFAKEIWGQILSKRGDNEVIALAFPLYLHLIHSYT